MLAPADVESFLKKLSGEDRWILAVLAGREPWVSDNPEILQRVIRLGQDLTTHRDSDSLSDVDSKAVTGFLTYMQLDQYIITMRYLVDVAPDRVASLGDDISGDPQSLLWWQAVTGRLYTLARSRVLNSVFSLPQVRLINRALMTSGDPGNITHEDNSSD